MKPARLGACVLGAALAVLIAGCQYPVPSLPVPSSRPPTSSAMPTSTSATATLTPATTTAPTSTTTAPTTSARPPATTSRPTSVPATTTSRTSTTTATPIPAGDTAAARYGWGTPLPASDEFDYTGPPDAGKWWTAGECWPANSTAQAGRCASHSSVGNGFLRETGTTDGRTGWLGSKFGQRYGRWEVRARVLTQGSGRSFHPVLLTWPDSDAWPSGGEYDFFEVDSGDNAVTAFMHHPTSSGVVQDSYRSDPVDLTQWHNYGFEWSPTGLTGYIDGQVWFHDTDPKAQAPGPMHQTIQLDCFETGPMQLTYFDVDWARVYPLR